MLYPARFLPVVCLKVLGTGVVIDVDLGADRFGRSVLGTGVDRGLGTWQGVW